ncbi:MAG TPA: phosphatase PAP2 family protein [Thermoanaerobaculia bacterium]|nr:phosphatase PAP2 family protein [Thermoanaerobaculia bacterium]
MSIDAKRRIAAFAFVALLVLSVFWPSPIVSVNRLCCDASLGIDDLSFLGREAPAWDALFWCIAGLFAIGIVHSGSPSLDDLRPYRALRLRVSGAFIAVALAALAMTFAIARFADARVTAWAEGMQSDATEDFVRILNRLGGGMNPGLVVLFFLIAGLAYRHRAWIGYAIAMALSGLGAGIVAQLVKFATLRGRPELWLGPFVHAKSSASSFPSGHTVGAFALGGVLLFASRSLPVRFIAIALATAIGVSRIFAFRHWASDVFASAAAGLLVSWIVTAAVSRITQSAAAEP